MTTVERDPEFRARLVALYHEDNFGAADQIIHYARVYPETYLVTADQGRTLMFGLELWAALHNQKHPALEVDEEIRATNRKCWRVVTRGRMPLEALHLLTQSPYGVGFAADIQSLRPRLASIAQKDDAFDRRETAKDNQTKSA